MPLKPVRTDHQDGSGINRYLNFDNMPISDLATAFQVSIATVSKWHQDGCPRNQNGTYCFLYVHRWKVAKEVERLVPDEGKLSLKDQKLQKEIERLESINQKLREELVPRSEMNEREAAFGKETFENIERSFMKNATVFAMKSVEDIRIIFREFLCQMTSYMAKADGDDAN
jgi:hypothetical protein